MHQHTHAASKYTQHALTRSQQRGIPPVIIEWLLRFGETEWSHDGGRVKYFTRKSRRRMESAVGAEVTRRMHEFLDCYAVVGIDGALVTCGHRYKRITRH